MFRICNGNREAIDWIQLGHAYCHEIDDLIDESVPRADRADAVNRVCRIGAMAIRLYTHPFFLQNSQALASAMMVNTINYRDSVLWEGSDVEWQKTFSDWARHGWIDIVLVVSELCGGYESSASDSLELRALAYTNHHDGSGKVI